MQTVLVKRTSTIIAQYTSPIHEALQSLQEVALEGHWSYVTPYTGEGSIKAAERLCRKAIHDGMCTKAQRVWNKVKGLVFCEFYSAPGDVFPLLFMVDNNLIQKKRNGELYNISFDLFKINFALKLAGFEPLKKITLSQFVDQKTGEILEGVLNDERYVD